MIKKIWAYIGYTWFVIMLILVGFFCGDLRVKAETNASYSSVKFEVEQCTVVLQTDNPHYGTCVWDSRTGMGTSNKITFGSSNGHLRKIQLQVFGSNSIVYPAGSYTFEAVIVQDPRNLDGINSTYFFRIYGSGSASGSGASSGTDTFSSKSCSLSAGSTNYQYVLTCVFNTSRDLKYFNFSLEAKSDNHVAYNTNAIYWGSINRFFYNTDSTGAINNQTSIIQNEFNQTNENIDSLKDDDIDSPDDMISDFEDMLPTNGTITQLLTLPIQWYTKILNSVNGTCSSFNLGSLYGTNLLLPCIELSDYLGSSLVNTLDLLMSGFFILAIAKKMIKAFDSFTSMKEGDVIDD